ncbi:MAG: DUF2213 domain-containing protein [Deltaproteobacteria bacterium]|nr:DUF2213 domain-containing protein [Deltaproteobacteria bacterium]
MGIIETDDEIIVESITLTREMVQELDDGSKAFKPFEELVKASKVKSIPLVYSHPETETGTVEDVDSVIGYVDDIHPDEKDRSLKGKIHFYKDITPNEVLEHLQKNLPIEGSIGGFAKDLGNSGVFNSEKYDVSQLGIMLNHYAISLTDKGRCSVEDGCGIGIITDFSKEKLNYRSLSEQKGELKSNNSSNFKQQHKQSDYMSSNVKTEIKDQETEPQVDKDALIKQLQEELAAVKAELAKYKEKETADLKNEITENSDYKPEDLKDMKICDLRLVRDAIMKVKKPKNDEESDDGYQALPRQQIKDSQVKKPLNLWEEQGKKVIYGDVKW